MEKLLEDYLLEKGIYTEKMGEMLDELDDLQEIERMMTELEFEDLDELNLRLDVANNYINSCKVSIKKLDEKIEVLKEVLKEGK